MKKSYVEMVRDWEFLLLLCQLKFDLTIRDPSGPPVPQQPPPPAGTTEKV